MLSVYFKEIRSFVASNKDMDASDKIGYIFSLLITVMFMRKYGDPVCMIESTMEKLVRIGKLASMLFIVSTFIYGIYRTVRVTSGRD